MAKTKQVYYCQDCGSQFNQWQGQCGQCGEWNSIVEEVATPSTQNTANQGFSSETSQLTLLSDVSMQSQPRLSTGIHEFDHVLGGGLVADSVVLIGGDPGIGKSTLLLQILAELGRREQPLYVTGEESLQQIALRAQRLQILPESLTLLAETNVERIIALAQQMRPRILVIDSIQTLFTSRVAAAPGGVSQVRESAAQLVRFAKQTNTALLMIGHVTKEGSIAGPRVLEHMVDAVLYFEGQSDRRYRVIRAVKNRFGAVNEIGVFAMTDSGLKQVNNPSAIFLSNCQQAVAGSAIMVTWEGSRPLLVEIQALVDTSHLANPRRVTVGLDHNRLSMLLAVLHRHAGIATYDQDVFINAVGGLRISEPGADLAVICSVLSSLQNKPIGAECILLGEVGLSGEIRPVPSGQERLREAAKHGFKRAIIPKANQPKRPIEGMEVNAVATLAEVLALL